MGEREREDDARKGLHRGCPGVTRAAITVNIPSVCFVLVSRRNFTRRSRDENCSPVLRKSAPPSLSAQLRIKVSYPRGELKTVQSVCVYIYIYGI